MIRFAAVGLLLLLPSLTFAQDARPRVLALTDPVQRPILADAAKEFSEQLRIEFPRIDRANHTAAAIAQLEEVLGQGEWDLIYLSFGLGDLTYRDPRTEEIRSLSKQAGGVRVATPEQYEKNLETLVKQLRERGLKLVWGNTTPLVELRYHYNVYDAGSEVEYNQIAARVMARHKVPVCDLHGHILAHLEDSAKHPSFTEYHKALRMTAPLHQLVGKRLLEALAAD